MIDLNRSVTSVYSSGKARISISGFFDTEEREKLELVWSADFYSSTGHLS